MGGGEPLGNERNEYPLRVDVDRPFSKITHWVRLPTHVSRKWDKIKTGERETDRQSDFMATLTNSWFRVKLCSFLRRGYSCSPSAPRCSLQPPDVNLLAESARISLTPKEVLENHHHHMMLFVSVICCM